MADLTDMENIADMDDRALLRYSRQIALEGFGIAGQRRLAAASVLLVGLGGIGAPAARYLCGAGVGRLLLADGDSVEVSNLHRQTLYLDGDDGQGKAALAARRLARANPDCELRALGHLDGEALDEAVAGADLVLDGSDSFATRRAVNLACVRRRVPLLSASVALWDGQVALFAAGGRPCYACLFPPPSQGDEAEEEEQGCADTGVLGPTAGVVASLAAQQALLWLAGGPAPSAGGLLLYDARAASLRRVALQADPGCAVCAGQGRG